MAELKLTDGILARRGGMIARSNWLSKRPAPRKWQDVGLHRDSWGVGWVPSMGIQPARASKQRHGYIILYLTYSVAKHQP